MRLFVKCSILFLYQVTADENVKELATVLQQFMEGATLGEYSTRLMMLESFHYQLVCVSVPSKPGNIPLTLDMIEQICYSIRYPNRRL